MRKLTSLFLPVLLFAMSCAHKYEGREPDFEIKSAQERNKEFQQFKLEKYKIPSPHYFNLKFRDMPVRPENLEHVLEATKPGTYKQMKTHHWGAYIAWISAIPFAIFLSQSISDFNVTNLFLLTTTASTFVYGSYLERQHKNRVIDSYNRELKIKLDLIKTDF